MGYYLMWPLEVTQVPLSERGRYELEDRKHTRDAAVMKLNWNCRSQNVFFVFFLIIIVLIHICHRGDASFRSFLQWAWFHVTFLVTPMVTENGETE